MSPQRDSNPGHQPCRWATHDLSDPNLRKGSMLESFRSIWALRNRRRNATSRFTNCPRIPAPPAVTLYPTKPPLAAVEQ
ncbi:unnamed protein product [Protopolystoma xenopodis]|uniref:Uncharacterized protein n=1 Tax=Protopolystoma xenopodis TaxID=117903 RepID=A0A3S5BE07_9PLAT|nr:unnamed protein product [Protopolystoma xenopodis]